MLMLAYMTTYCIYNSSKSAVKTLRGVLSFGTIVLFHLSWISAIISSSPFCHHRYKLWGVGNRRNEEKDTIEAEYHILDCLQMLRRDWRLFKMSTAALEHLRTGEGGNLCSAKRTELSKLYVDQVFVCKTCTVKDLSVVTIVKWTGEKLTTQGVKTSVIYSFLISAILDSRRRWRWIIAPHIWAGLVW